MGFGLSPDWVGFGFRLGWVWVQIGLGLVSDGVGFGFRLGWVCI